MPKSPASCSRRLHRGISRCAAFTLIELLVVVAIIAMLISILLPSLGKARAQARGTLCASRISQMAKAFLIYADDYGETPPFICYGRGTGALYGPDPNENWLVNGQSGTRSYAAILWDSPESDWPFNWAQTGTLFTYTRFETLYRCPEFERVSAANAMQRKFNYSRSSLGRKVQFDAAHLMDTSLPARPYGFGYDGPIMKPSSVYASSQVPLVVDEASDGYVADYGTSNFTWDHCDPIMDLVDSFVGDYHGSPILGVANVNDVWQTNYPRKSGSLAMYDGHVELVRDWYPRVGGNNVGGGRPLIDFFTPSVRAAAKQMLDILFYSQRGEPTPLE